MPHKISSLDDGYLVGDLSFYPEALDSKDSLFEVKNNAISKLSQTLPYNGKYIVLDDDSKFPSQGIVRLGGEPGTNGTSELVYYGKKSDGILQDLTRGFAKTRQNPWPKGTTICNPVCADPHNALKDSLIKIQQNLGLESSPLTDSLNGLLDKLEQKFLAPKPIFRAFPNKGAPPLKVRFQNFVTGQAIRYLWDFGDGTQSIEPNPIHTYYAEGIYTVKLDIISASLGEGIVTKTNYITVSDQERLPFFYVTPTEGYSVAKAAQLTAQGTPTEPTEFVFMDQTDGDIIQRYWVFGDGETESQDDSNIHFTKHIFNTAGTYEPTILNLFSNQRLKRIFLNNSITVY